MCCRLSVSVTNECFQVKSLATPSIHWLSHRHHPNMKCGYDAQLHAWLSHTGIKRSQTPSTCPTRSAVRACKTWTQKLHSGGDCKNQTLANRVMIRYSIKYTVFADALAPLGHQGICNNHFNDGGRYRVCVYRE